MFGALTRHRIHVSIQMFVTFLRLPLQSEILFYGTIPL
jgi:hypothetical protein